MAEVTQADKAIAKQVANSRIGGRDNGMAYAAALEAAALSRTTAEAAKDARIAELEAALGLALDVLVAFEPGDSRAVSDQFVAMAAVLSGYANDEAMDIIRKARAALQEIEHGIS